MSLDFALGPMGDICSIRENGGLVPRRGLEPPPTCVDMDLNHARLPIPPPGHTMWAAQFTEGLAPLSNGPPVVKPHD